VFADGLLAGFWGGAAVLVGGYVALFLLARRPVSLQLRRLGWLFLAVLVLCLVLLLCSPAPGPFDLALAGVALVGGVALWSAGRVWVLRAEAAVLREQIQTACRGLFLELAESKPGLFLLTAKANTWPLRVIGLGRRLQLVVVPRVAGPSKAGLLVHWLSMQYPGPVPRIHIVLRKE
jgi:hypothetical protein